MGLFEGFLSDRGHDKVEVAFSLAVSDLIQHDLGFNSDPSRFTNEYTLQALEHLENVDRIHAAILIVIAQLEHNCHEREKRKC